MSSTIGQCQVFATEVVMLVGIIAGGESVFLSMWRYQHKVGADVHGLLIPDTREKTVQEETQGLPFVKA